ncbi:MAG: helix-turn-helix domain-containing protein [Sphingomonadales bacterium]|nr:helix-turn-helix domain-containing protein [Sphingomonadaceae bacterium]MBS3930791.1 helix-turn-helix domain-containing protein [Sphingomonadales bacterium]
MSVPDYMTVKDLAAKLKIREETVRHEIGEGKLPAAKIGNGWRIDPDDALAWIESRKVSHLTDRRKKVDLPRDPAAQTFALGKVAS